MKTILALLQAFPFFAEIYQEIAAFMTNPEELMNMLSKELYIMDRNEERMMGTELQEEVASAKAEAESAKADAEAAKVEAKAANVKAESAIAERDAVKSAYRSLKDENTSLQDQNDKLLTWAREHGYQE